MYYSNSSKAFPEDIQCVLDPINGKGGIYISNVEAAQNIHTLKKHGIQAVLTAAFNIKLTHSKNEIPFYKHVPGKDHQQFNLAVYFDESVDFIDKALEKTNILVHCMAGISRSVTLVLAFLIKKKGMKYDDAYLMIKSKRRIIHPNDGFIKQLRNYELECQQRAGRQRSQSPTRNIADMTKVSNYSRVQFERKGSQYESPLKKYDSSQYYDSSPLKRFYDSTQKFSRYESPLKKYSSKMYEAEPLHPSNRLLNPEGSTRGFSGLKYTSDRYSHLIYNPKDNLSKDYGSVNNNEDYIEKRIAEIRKKQSIPEDYRRSGHVKSKSIMENVDKLKRHSNYDTVPMRDLDRLSMRKLSSMYDYMKY